MISRPELLGNIRKALRRSPAVALLGPRQSGKTTLARMLLPAGSENYFDLEGTASLRRLDDPEAALGGLRGLVVIDEVQRKPELFPVLRVLARPAAQAGPLPASWQRFAGVVASILRVAGRTHRGYPNRRL